MINTNIGIRELDKQFYGEYEDNWDNDVFRSYILDRVDKSYTILDLGAGRGILTSMDFSKDVNFVAGADPDPAVKDNPFLDEAKVMNNNEIPYDSGVFDAVISNNVIEHVEKPAVLFREVSRVLKKGGVFMSKTPNKYHYVPLIARATPHKFHEYINNLRGRNEIDTFPTLYRCNTKAKVERIVSGAGMELKNVKFVEGRPEYLRVNMVLYLIGLIYERIVNSSDILAQLRCIIILEAEAN